MFKIFSAKAHQSQFPLQQNTLVKKVENEVKKDGT